MICGSSSAPFRMKLWARETEKCTFHSAPIITFEWRIIRNMYVGAIIVSTILSPISSSTYNHRNKLPDNVSANGSLYLLLLCELNHVLRSLYARSKKEWLITHLENTFLLCLNERRRWDRWVWKSGWSSGLKLNSFWFRNANAYTHISNDSIQYFFFAAMSTHKQLFYTIIIISTMLKALSGDGQLWLIIDDKKLWFSSLRNAHSLCKMRPPWNCSSKSNNFLN